jgi:RNA polymerase sigma-70 factor (ECF subfamily)
MPLRHAIAAGPRFDARPLASPWLDGDRRSTFQAMAAQAAPGETADASPAGEEARLARAAAEGDGGAFATLYERYERRAYNLAYRLTASEDDAADAVQDAFLNVMRRLPHLQGRDLAFGSYLFTATRNAAYDLMSKRRRAQPSDSIPESAAPVGSGAGGLGLDPGDPDEDPDRRLLLESQQEEIRAANERLPERQREALALRELEELSYDEIASIMDMNRNSVAQLISRARIKLREELRGGALVSIAAASPECERALPLIAMRDDRQLDDGSDDSAWLDTHVASCATCRLGVEAMQEAGASYRAWAPVAAAPWLFRETLAKAAELTGSDWSETIAERSASRDPGAIQPGMPSAYRSLAAPVEQGGKRRRRLVAAGALATALLLGAVASVLGDDDPPVPAEPAAETSAAPAAEGADAAAPKRQARKATGRRGRRRQATTAPRADPGPSAGLVPAPAGSGRGGSSGDEPARPKPKPRAPDRPVSSPPVADPPRPRPGPEPEPVPDPPPVVEQPPVVEDPPPPPDPPPGGDPEPPPIL